ncbi:hypothetical protein QYE76_025406 [Lolium multiflorum]|uniref:Transposase (putative) gypsy type domain-containing protein n=1 Tax=Lolium multiflorum TaxID=4521 RepID=A0AAD8RHV4_LOLMU|nr:hypothetical protein QYE76_025406 [Lolium multiflorum]
MPPERYRGALLPPRALVLFFLPFELFATPARSLHRFPGELRRAAAPTYFRRAAATTPPIQRHGAARVDGTLFSTALSPARSGSSSPFRLSWSSSSSSSSMAQPGGSWRGSYMREDDIERLGRLRRIPAGVITRAPGVEMEPRPEPGERVVFGAHLDRGLGLPASDFFRRFLDFFGLQPHHLPANAFILLSCYVAFMEGYAGLWPDVDFGAGSSQGTIEGHLRTCGAASIYPRTGTSFPRIPTVDSVKNWQMSFFYVRNDNLAFDRLNLPENPAPPRPINGATTPDGGPGRGGESSRGTSWESASRGPADRRGPPRTYTERRCRRSRACPQDRAHVRADPTRTSKVELTKAQLFDRQGVEDGDLAQKIWTPDHVDPADQAGDQVGDDDLPEVPDQGGQGEHNPPPSPEHEPEPEEPAESGTGPIPAPPALEAAGRLHAPGRKPRRRVHGQAGRLRPRSTGWSPRRAAIKFTQGGGSRPPPRAEPTLSRQRRESTRQLRCARLRYRRAVCGSSFTAPPSRRPPRRQGEPVHRPTLMNCFAPCSALELARPGWQGECIQHRRRRPPPDQPLDVPPPPEAEGGAREGAGKGGAGRPKDADSRALVRQEGPSGPSEGLHVAKGARLLHVPSASDSSLGSAGTMEKAWHQADACEVTSREASGVAPMKMFFSGYRASLKAKAAETLAQLATLEDADKVVAERRTVLYNQVVTSYHKAKIERAGLARELEVAKGELRLPGPAAGVGPSAARAQCAESERAGAAAKRRRPMGSQRLRRLEDNHLKELAALKKDGEEKLEGPSKGWRRWNGSGLRFAKR